MSVADLLDTIERLVQVVNEKNRELELLKEAYGTKLRDIGRYLDALNEVFGTVEFFEDGHNTDKRTISEAELARIAKKSIRCPNCETEVCNNAKNSDFVLIPRCHLEQKGSVGPRIHHSQGSAGVVQSSGTTEEHLPSYQSHRPQLMQDPSHSPTPLPSQKRAGKKTCSYCHQQGHSRARCLQRLNNDTGSFQK